jgi:hypothetical protein
LLVVAISLLPGGAIWAEEVVVADFLQTTQEIPQDWKLSVHEGAADLTLVPDGDGRALRLRSRLSSFSLGKTVDIDLKKTPYLAWEWKVTELPDGGDFRRRATDDQAAQLIVVFSWGIFRGEAIVYMWDSTAPEGTVSRLPSPPLYPFLNLYGLVVRSAEAQTGAWISETRNVVADYRGLFGKEPERVLGIGIQINSQHTRSQAEAYWRTVKFKALAERAGSMPPAGRPVRWNSARMTAGTRQDAVGSDGGSGPSPVHAEANRPDLSPGFGKSGGSP